VKWRSKTSSIFGSGSCSFAAVTDSGRADGRCGPVVATKVRRLFLLESNNPLNTSILIIIVILHRSNSIWQHLVTLTQTERITVIITTHYIEEARQAHYVGLMRQGRLLAENSPEQLLAQYNMETLEEVFLKLCMTDSSTKEGRAELMQNGLFADLSGGSTQKVATISSGFDNPALDLDQETVANNNNNISKVQDNNNGTTGDNQSKVRFRIPALKQTIVSLINLIPCPFETAEQCLFKLHAKRVCPSRKAATKSSV
jgi:hypothetical protein